MPDTKLSFAERCALLRDAADDLKRLAEVVKLEALRMTSASQRFAERRTRKASR